MIDKTDLCPKCGAPLGEVIETKTGKRFQRCSNGSWNPKTRSSEGCDYVKWHVVEPVTLKENCPKCGAPLLLITTRNNKKMKKCSSSSWDFKTRTASGCDYVEWIKGTTETLDEFCPKCKARLILYTSPSGKKLKKCSTSGWDPIEKKAIGCDFVQWQNQNA